MEGQKEGQEEEGIVHPLMKLPNELRGEIFKRVPQKDSGKLRSVCRQWKEEVDMYYDYKISLDDRNPHLQQMLQLRIKEIVVVRYFKSQPIILKNPSLVKIIKAPQFGIDVVNLHRLLSSCAEYVEEVELGDTPTVYLSFPLHSDFRYNFANLTSLKVTSSDREQDEDFPTDLTKLKGGSIFNHIESPRLATLVIDIQRETIVNTKSQKTRSKFIMSILSMIARNHNSLKNLKLSLSDRFDLMDRRLLSHSENLSPADFSGLKKLALKNLQVHACLNSNFWPQLSRLLVNENQKEMEKVTLFMNLGAYPAPTHLHRDLLHHNRNTIVEVTINGLSTGDMSIFQNCEKLKKLTLQGDFDDSVDHSKDDPPEVTSNVELLKIYRLPKSIEKLRIWNHWIDTEDLLNYFSSTERACNLKSLFLTLNGCGRFGRVGFGATVDVLEAILKLPEIKNITICALKTESPEEKERLDIIYANLSVKGEFEKYVGEPPIWLKRESVDKPWKSGV